MAMLLLLLALSRAEGLALQADASEALRKTRAESNYELTFESRTRAAKGDPLDRKGSARWWKAGVILLDIESSGKRFTRAVRAGVQYGCPTPTHTPSFKSTPCEICQAPRAPTKLPRVWVYDSFVGWLSADQAGQPGVASGFQNPDEVLGLMANYSNQAKAAGNDFEITLEGKDALKVVDKLAPGNGLVATDGKLSTLLKLDPQGRVARIDIEATLATPEGVAHFKSSARIGTFGQVAVPAAMGTVPFSADLAAAIANQLK